MESRVRGTSRLRSSCLSKDPKNESEDIIHELVSHKGESPLPKFNRSFIKSDSYEDDLLEDSMPRKKKLSQRKSIRRNELRRQSSNFIEENIEKIQEIQHSKSKFFSNDQSTDIKAQLSIKQQQSIEKMAKFYREQNKKNNVSLEQIIDLGKGMEGEYTDIPLRKKKPVQMFDHSHGIGSNLQNLCGGCSSHREVKSSAIHNSYNHNCLKQEKARNIFEFQMKKQQKQLKMKMDDYSPAKLMQHDFNRKFK